MCISFCSAAAIKNSIYIICTTWLDKNMQSKYLNNLQQQLIDLSAIRSAMLMFAHVKRERSLLVVALLSYMLPRSFADALSNIFAYSFAVRLQIQLVVNETAARANVSGRQRGSSDSGNNFFTLLMQKLTFVRRDDRTTTTNGRAGINVLFD